jgi:hypothetical protein
MSYKFPEGAKCVRSSDGATSTSNEDYLLLVRTLSKNKERMNAVEKAYNLLKMEKLSQADKHKRVISHLHHLLFDAKHEEKMKEKEDVMLWKTVIKLGSPLIHSMANGVIDRLIEVIHSGASETAIETSWNKLVDPATYMRPSAAPAQQLIDEAEKFFQDMKITKDDFKRYLMYV